MLALIALSLIWGYNWVVMKECLKYSGVYDFAALRTGIGAASLFVLLIWKRRPLRPKAIGMTILLGFLATTLCIGLVTLALATGGVGKTAILVYIMPFWVLLMAWPILSERIRGIQWVPVVLAIAGLTIILEPWQLRSTFISKLFAVLAGVAWALSTIVTKIMTRKDAFDLISLTAWQMLLGALPLIVLAMVVPERPVQWTPYFITGLLFCSVISQGLALLHVVLHPERTARGDGKHGDSRHAGDRYHCGFDRTWRTAVGSRSLGDAADPDGAFHPVAVGVHAAAAAPIRDRGRAQEKFFRLHYAATSLRMSAIGGRCTALQLHRRSEHGKDDGTADVAGTQGF